MVKLRGKVRSGLVVGIGPWGARVASAFAQDLRRRAGDVPVVRTAVLDAADVEIPSPVARLSGEQTTDLLAELEATRKLDAVRATQRAGWDVDGKTPPAVTLVAALGDEAACEQTLQVARSLRDVATGSTIQRLTLGAVLLLCPAPDGDPGEGGAALLPRIPDGIIFDDGCYLLGRANADGLLLFDCQDEQGRAHQAELVACWLVLCALTEMDVILARVPLDEATEYRAFGLARWCFPLEALKTYLARRWQVEALDQLLAPPQNDEAPHSFLEQHVQHGVPWSEASAMRFRVKGEAWASPALRLVPTLREAIEQAVASEQERLQALIAQAERGIEAIGDEIVQTLTVATDAMLDEIGLGATQRFLDALAEAAERCVARCERLVAQRFERLEVLDARATEAAQALQECTERFPPFRLRTLLGLIVRPWRLLRLWLLYREIGRRVGVYLSYCQSRWLLQVETFEHQWQAALYARLAQAIREEWDDVANLRAALEQLREHQAPDAELERSVVRGLEETALPGDLGDRLYRRAVGDDGPDVDHLLALHGPLSLWAREEFRADVLGAILLDHAWEAFAFLDEVRLDDLLARTLPGAALRRYLSALVEEAAPWWVWDEARFPSAGPARGHRTTLVGLPDVERSPLVDLLPRRSVCFSTGDRRQVFAIRVVRGVWAPSGSTEEGEG